MDGQEAGTQSSHESDLFSEVIFYATLRDTTKVRFSMKQNVKMTPLMQRVKLQTEVLLPLLRHLRA